MRTTSAPKPRRPREGSTPAASRRVTARAATRTARRAAVCSTSSPPKIAARVSSRHLGHPDRREAPRRGPMARLQRKALQKRV